MSTQAAKFFAKHNINPSHIVYINREDSKSVLHLMDGRIIACFLPVKKMLEELSTDDYLSINKGVCINKQHIASITGNNYLMTDGTTLTGRVRAAGEHKRNKTEQETRRSLIVSMQNTLDSLASKGDFSVFDNLPVAYCVVEMKYDNDNRGIDFVLLYGNKEMERMKGWTLDEMKGKSFYDLFENAQPDWLINYGDVALNGTTRDIMTMSPELGKMIRIIIYQPAPGLCACLIIPEMDPE